MTGTIRAGRKFAVVLSLDPLGDPSLPHDSLAPSPLSVENCLAAIEECRAPIVSVTGGEPLQYPQIAELSRSILASGRHLFLHTNGLLIRRWLHMIPPETRFFWNIQLDGTEAFHDARYQQPGLFAEALDGVKAAKNAGFFVIASTTVCPDTDPADVEALYDRLHSLHVDGYLLAPAYLSKAVCCNSSKKFHSDMKQKFRDLTARVGGYNLMMSPLYMEFLRGERELDCCVWASPTFGPRGWASPCSTLNHGYVRSYRDLIEKTVWENYGRGMNPKCETCMSADGYESAALLGSNPKAGDLWKLLSWQFSGGLGERRNGGGRA